MRTFCPILAFTAPTERATVSGDTMYRIDLIFHTGHTDTWPASPACYMHCFRSLGLSAGLTPQEHLEGLLTTPPTHSVHKIAHKNGRNPAIKYLDSGFFYVVFASVSSSSGKPGVQNQLRWGWLCRLGGPLSPVPSWEPSDLGRNQWQGSGSGSIPTGLNLPGTSHREKLHRNLTKPGAVVHTCGHCCPEGRRFRASLAT